VRAKLKSRLVAIAFICCAVSVATWFSVQWWPQHNPQDFEQCSEEAEGTASSKDERISLIAQCSKQFVGRRKMGGGYTYYDFLQNRHFDIAGPNPTPKENTSTNNTRYTWMPKDEMQLQQPLQKSRAEWRNQIFRTIVSRARYLRQDYPW